MGKATLSTFSLEELKMEAGETNLGWAKFLLEVVSRIPGNPVPGSVTTVMQMILDDLKVSRHYWEALLGTSLSVKIGETVAIDDYSNSDKVKKLLSARTIMLAPDLELVDPALTYDNVRHNFSWKGCLIELREAGGSADSADVFCVVHPDDNFEPVAILGNLRVIRSCTQRNPNFANEVRRNGLSYEDRQRILKERERLLKLM